MPTYDYHCDACQAEFETVQSIHDESLTDCPHCHEPKLRRLISGAGVIFKGSGFYINDSKKDSQKGNQKSGEASASPATANSTTSSSSPAAGNSPATSSPCPPAKGAGD